MSSTLFARYILRATGVLAVWVILTAPARVGAGDRSPIERAIDFLVAHQVGQPVNAIVDGARVVDFAGNWPQYFHLKGNEAFRVRDVSPFTVAFIHHSLSQVVEENRRALGLSRHDLGAARLMRQRAVAFMKGFESTPDAPDAGTFGFWPYDTDPATPDLFTSAFLTWWLQGPILGGERVPINLSIYPSTLAIPTDADVTATTYAALLDDVIFDEGPGSQVAFERFFVDWRDTGIVPRRLNPIWLPPASGAFLTWLTYRDAPFPRFPNDVDLVVNGNALYALGRYGRLNVPGVAEAVALINFVTTSGVYRQQFEEISEYYPDNFAFQYVVSRAFHEGSVTALAPAVRVFADDLEASVVIRTDGAAYWDKGAPHLNTAFAVLTLLNAGRDIPIVDRAIEYLIAEQAGSGGFGEAAFFFGRTDSGVVFEFSSESFTTAIALEALARYRIARCGHEERRSTVGEFAVCR